MTNSQLKNIDPHRISQLKRPPEICLQDEALLDSLLKTHKISNSEFEKILGIKGSAPTLTELGVFSAMWSEHCSYKSSRIHLKRLPTTGSNVVVGPGENAGVVKLEGDICVAFKMESHNHPSYIEPYQGAATGVGGILRDVFCMGARPFANLNCLRFGEKNLEKTRHLVPRVVRGVGDYGNCVGVPTVGGSISYNKSYNGNCLVNAMTAGLVHREKIFKGFAAGIGNLVVYVGSATGRDGIHGATMASDSFEDSGSASKLTSKTPSKIPSKTTVQVGDPFVEKLLMEATLEVLEKNLVVGIQDMGAAGLTSSSFEMAGRAENGIYLNLNLVPTRAKKMSAYEIMLSESQERMLMVVERAKWDALKEVLAKWQLPHAIIGEVTATGRMQIEAENILEVDLPVAPLTDSAPIYDRPIAKPEAKIKKSDRLDELKKILMLDVEATKNIFFGILEDSGSKAQIFEQYDRHIGTRSVLGSDHGGVAVMWIRSEETAHHPFLGVALSAGCNERRVKNTPKIGAAEAVLKCAREMAAAGGVPLAITDCLNFGSPEDSLVMRELSDSVDGITEACRHLDVPVVSGNVSLYNATDGSSIHPTPMIGMVGRVNDVRKVTRAIVANAEDLVFSLITPTESLDGESALAASLAATKYGISSIDGAIAPIDWETEITTINALHKLRDAGCLESARAVGEGGAGIVALKMLEPIFGDIQSVKYLIQNGVDFFGEGGSRYLVVIPASLREKASKIINEHGLHLVDVAEVSCVSKKKDQEKSISQMGKVQTYFGHFSLDELRQIYKNQGLGGG